MTHNLSPMESKSPLWRETDDLTMQLILPDVELLEFGIAQQLLLIVNSLQIIIALLSLRFECGNLGTRSRTEARLTDNFYSFKSRITHVLEILFL